MYTERGTPQRTAAPRGMPITRWSVDKNPRVANSRGSGGAGGAARHAGDRVTRQLGLSDRNEREQVKLRRRPARAPPAGSQYF